MIEAPFPIVSKTEEDLRKRQAVTRAEGRCGSFQTQSGEPCRRIPSAGYTVCRKHGARAPQTISKAERLLAIARMPAIEWIMDQVDQAHEEPCGTCGYPKQGPKERKRIDTLAFKLLDRTGFGPRQTIDVNASRNEAGVDVSLLNAEELAELDQLLDAMDQFKARATARHAREGAGRILNANSAGVPAIGLLQSALADAEPPVT